MKDKSKRFHKFIPAADIRSVTIKKQPFHKPTPAEEGAEKRGKWVGEWV